MILIKQVKILRMKLTLTLLTIILKYDWDLLDDPCSSSHESLISLLIMLMYFLIPFLFVL
jgi:hypothetical protein